ncbi:hypothetical protein LX83_001661 [Goodfellowiella coeruleoviolacea]|uniref:Excalibur calcium-binding domain-containing protein n=1 Tax=Goodfellowiella coeruleoviolacea TaxID=334858 RepID=A0AAE3GAR8_9PSEU|nr:hypothetical protein [Goodfellowiella coeruleoviolacea]
MLENSSTGLTMVAGEVPVTVTREEHHQAVLRRYQVSAGSERRVAVELGWCTIRSGKYRGRRAIEVRLDGRRVGELTHLMSERYTPLITRVIRAGGTPGCEALIRRGPQKLEVVLRLPRRADGPIPLPETPPSAATRPTAVQPTATRPTATRPVAARSSVTKSPGLPPARPRPAVTPPPRVPVGTPTVSAPPPRNTSSSHPFAWAAAAVAGVFVVAAIVNSTNDSPATTAAAHLRTSTTAVSTTRPATSTTTAPPTTTPPPSSQVTPTTVPVPAQPAVPTTQPPAPRTTTPKTTTPTTAAKQPTKAAPPATTTTRAQSKCDPNYTGCVPVARDVDCAGGSGNGPAYVQGPVRVIGKDVYGLDNDDDGIACE